MKKIFSCLLFVVVLWGAVCVVADNRHELLGELAIIDVHGPKDITRQEASVIEVQNVGSNWEKSQGRYWFLRADVYAQDKGIPLKDVYDLNVGDWVVLINDWTQDFIDEHDMNGLWNGIRDLELGNPGNTILYYRQIESIDAINNTITIDVPIRYFLKTRDGARVYKCPPFVTEVGLEEFSVGGALPDKPGIDSSDFDKPGTAAYDVHGATLIRFDGTLNSWARNINSFCHEDNKKGVHGEKEFHFPSHGIRVLHSRGVTVENCVMQKPLYQGNGGNGYLFMVESNEVLLKDNTSIMGRHGVSISRGYCSGTVILRHNDINASNSLDMHAGISVANLFDSTKIYNLPQYKTVLNGGGSIKSMYRPYGQGCFIGCYKSS